MAIPKLLPVPPDDLPSTVGSRVLVLRKGYKLDGPGSKSRGGKGFHLFL